jgi:hypothetical protein
MTTISKENIVNALNLSQDLVALRILMVRGAKVMLDADLADLYGVPTKVSIRQYVAMLIDSQKILCLS